MVTNVGLDRGHPYLEAGADDGEFSLVGDRVTVTRTAARAVTFTMERSVDGVDWERVLADTITGDGANLVDYESLSHGDTLYRAVAFTVEGATAETIITVTADSIALWLSGGPAFGTTARLPLNPDVKHTAGRQRALKQYAGRSKPVALTGEALSRTVDVSGMVTDHTFIEETASPEELVELAQLSDDVFLFRDPDGRRIYGQIGDINMPRQYGAGDTTQWNGFWGYSFTLVETDKT